jgi:crotonobetainyl-CoA:carnitine CoA-transferase CaiB-like acyl-CoA transferase
MSGALEGIRIVDLTAMVTGPMATMILADQGADVIKIEPPGVGDYVRYLGSQRGGLASFFASVNRNKRSVVVNLKDEDGVALVRELAAGADVFVQNFRHGVIDRIGLGESALRKERPELVYVSINAFGETGPFAGRPAFDHILQGMTGTAYIQGDPPEFMRQAWIDKATALTAAQAITAALFARERGAGGQHVRLSMLDAGLSFLWPDGHASSMLLEEDALHLPPLAGTYLPVRTADGWAAVAAVTEEQWTNLMIAIGRPEVLADPRFATPAARMENLEEWRKIAAEGSPDMTTEQFVEHLHEADVPCGPVLTPEQAVEFEQVLANEMLVTSEHPVLGKIREPRPAARFEATPSKLERHAPALGENTDEVLAELGRTEAEISDLRKAGSVG